MYPRLPALLSLLLYLRDVKELHPIALEQLYVWDENSAAEQLIPRGLQLQAFSRS